MRDQLRQKGVLLWRRSSGLLLIDRKHGSGQAPLSFYLTTTMANTPSAAKRARQTERRSLINRRTTTSVKNQLKAVREALLSGKKDVAQAAAIHFVSTLDKAVKTGNVHKNTANRHKSAVNRALVALK